MMRSVVERWFTAVVAPFLATSSRAIHGRLSSTYGGHSGVLVVISANHASETRAGVQYVFSLQQIS